MSFCVECGASGPTFEGVCAEDFRKRHRLLRPPEYLDVTECVHCGMRRVRGGWSDVALEDAIPDLVRASAEVDPLVASVRYTHEVRHRHAQGLLVRVTASCRVGPWDLAEAFDVTVRAKSGACPTCSKRMGHYFVGTVQVRAVGRDLTKEEIRTVREHAERDGSGDEFVERIEEVRGGVDVRVSTNGFAKRLAKALMREFGGNVGTSATLHGQRKGKELYRSTYLVRIPGFLVGDEIVWRESRYRVLAVEGRALKLQAIEGGEAITVRAESLRRARLARR